MKDDKVVRLRSKRDKHLDDLALRLGDLLEGEAAADIMVVCAAVIAFVLRDTTRTPEAKEKKMAEISKFIRELVERRRDLSG
jgi:hypothetical protein